MRHPGPRVYVVHASNATIWFDCSDLSCKGTTNGDVVSLLPVRTGIGLLGIEPSHSVTLLSAGDAPLGD